MHLELCQIKVKQLKSWIGMRNNTFLVTDEIKMTKKRKWRGKVRSVFSVLASRTNRPAAETTSSCSSLGENTARTTMDSMILSSFSFFQPTVEPSSIKARWGEQTIHVVTLLYYDWTCPHYPASKKWPHLEHTVCTFKAIHTPYSPTAERRPNRPHRKRILIRLEYFPAASSCEHLLCMVFLDICAAKDTMPWAIRPFLLRLAWFAKTFQGNKWANDDALLIETTRYRKYFGKV